MVNLLFPLLLCLAASSTNAASLPKPTFGPPISMNLTDLYSSAENTAPLGDRGFGAVDPGFKVVSQLGDTPLRPIACLINAVNAMANLALQDFYASIGPVIIQLPSYPDVVIRSIAPALGPRTIPLRYILWGLWCGIAFMLDNHNFVTVRLTLSLHGRIVGYIMIEKPASQLITPVGSNDDDRSGESLEKRSDVVLAATSPSKSLVDSPNGTSISLANITSPSSNADGLRVFVAPIGQGLSVGDFFKPILGCLGYVARFPSTAPVAEFKVHRVDSDMLMEFRNYDPQPRSEAPFFEYQLIVKALRLLPATVLQLGRWTEVIIVMQVDGIKVGDGWLKKGVP